MALERLRQQLMQDPKLYNPDMMGQSKYGALPNVPIFTTYATRKDCCDAGVHPTRTAGIAGSVKEGGAYSVCLSGGYEDDKDDGDFFVYTGTGGQEDSSSWSGHGKQVCDQDFNHPHNAALKLSLDNKRNVRVIRGPNPNSKWAPVTEYRYDGLYAVQRAYYDKGKSGHRVCKYEFRRIEGQPPIPLNPAYKGATHFR